MSVNPICLGIIGAGTFSRDAHAPALLQLRNHFKVIAICDKDFSAAQTLSKDFKESRVYTNIEAILNDTEIEAVDIVLPPYIMPKIIKQALNHDKHVISEKPIAQTVAAGKQLIDFHKQKHNLVWEVAENWRHEDAIKKAEQIVKDGVLGKTVIFHWQIYYPIRPGHRYYQTGWRRSKNFSGNYVFDGGIHHIAAIRKILGEVRSVNSMNKLIHEDLGSMDTASINIELMDGTIGNYLVTYAVGSAWQSMLHIVGLKGCMSLNRSELNIFVGEEHQKFLFKKANALQDEFIDFYNAITFKNTLVNKPSESLKDVAVLEAFMKSVKGGQKVEVEFIN